MDPVVVLGGLCVLLLLAALGAWAYYRLWPALRLPIALAMMRREWYTRRPALFCFVDWVLFPGGLGFRYWLRYCWPRGWRLLPWCSIGVAFVVGWVRPYPCAAWSIAVLLWAAWLLWS